MAGKSGFARPPPTDVDPFQTLRCQLSRLRCRPSGYRSGRAWTGRLHVRRGRSSHDARYPSANSSPSFAPIGPTA